MMKPRKFRKRPVVIEAWQWNPKDQEDFMPSNWPKWMQGKGVKISFGSKLVIPTLEGSMTADKYDWIIKGVIDEIYPCKPGIFEATYEPIEQ